MTPTQAQLIRHKSRIGGVEIREEIPLGQVFVVDLDSIRIADSFDVQSGRTSIEEVIMEIDDGKYLPTDCLDWKNKRLRFN